MTFMTSEYAGQPARAWGVRMVGEASRLVDAVEARGIRWLR